jgi:hypothetical protein
MRHLRRTKRKPSHKQHGKQRPLIGNAYLLKVRALQSTLHHWDDLFTPGISEESRLQDLIRLNVVGNYLTDRYAWAIPNSRAINILSSFEPLIEMGCGLGYWSRLLHDQGIDIMPVDCIGPLRNSWTYVRKGGPSLLKSKSLQNRNLFLCYPDEDSQLGVECLKHFKGDYIIHVGEMITTGTVCAYPQSPWGKTSSADFQEDLMETFHCILSAKLPSFPVSNDFITVWKRTKYCRGQNHTDEEPDLWASIPVDERPVLDFAAPCVRHLLK